MTARKRLAEERFRLVQRGRDGKAKVKDKSDRFRRSTMIGMATTIGKTTPFEGERSYLDKYSIERSIED